MRALFPAFFFGCLFSFGLLLSVCPPCDPDACPPVTCGDPEAIVYDNCDCCPVCGKLEGELCGGDRDVGGMCVSGLYCSYRLGSIFGSQRMGTCEPGMCGREREREREREKEIERDRGCMHDCNL